MNNSSSKSELRKTLRERRQAISQAQRDSAATAVAGYLEQLSPSCQGAHIALYLPADGEVDTCALAEICRSAGAELYLPVVHDDGVMHFALWERGATLRVNRYGIPEPGPDYPLHTATELDIVFMPLVGWSKNGARLGMGGGFYDRALTLADKPVRVGLGFECQRLDQLQVDGWDIPMNFVATEAALHECREEG